MLEYPCREAVCHSQARYAMIQQKILQHLGIGQLWFSRDFQLIHDMVILCAGDLVGTGLLFRSALLHGGDENGSLFLQENGEPVTSEKVGEVIHIRVADAVSHKKKAVNLW